MNEYKGEQTPVDGIFIGKDLYLRAKDVIAWLKSLARTFDAAEARGLSADVPGTLRAHAERLEHKAKVE